MAKNKKTVAITIDPELWEMADEKLPVCRSQFIETQLKKYMGLEDSEIDILTKEIEELREEIQKLNDEINIRQTRICEIKKREEKEAQKEEELSSVKETLERFEEARGYASKKQLKTLAKHQDVSYDVLEKLCDEMDLKIIGG